MSGGLNPFLFRVGFLPDAFDAFTAQAEVLIPFYSGLVFYLSAKPSA
tara:strand:- start:316 stop:456 length:141 start_codon:yes stop_codon:yes gene_type:complete